MGLLAVLMIIVTRIKMDNTTKRLADLSTANVLNNQLIAFAVIVV